MSLNGVLVIDKPAGMTSHDVVAKVRKALGTKKVGHAGTLDPDATGILVLGIGNATRLLSYAQAGPKRYVAVASFGTSTTTQDASGEVIETRPVDLDSETVTRAAASFLGDIEQIPPMVSAVKVGGERLYKKARRGEDVERAPRPVTIHSLQMVAFQAESAEATFDVVCSPGTYVRTLVHDLGAALGCGAHLKTLRRTEASGFTEADAVPLDDAGPSQLRPAVDVVGTLPRLTLAPDALRLVADGRPLSAEVGDLRVSDLAEDAPVALVSDDTLLAVYKRRGDQLVAEKVLTP